MNRGIYLTSSVHLVAGDIGRKFQAEEKKLKLLFIDTAAEEEAGDKQWMRGDRQALVDAGFDVRDYTITGKTESEIEEALDEVDVIHVNGGVPFYMLYQIRATGFDKLVPKMLKKGKVYVGSSTGSMVAAKKMNVSSLFDEGEWSKKMNGDFRGMGLVDLLVLPHWGQEDLRSDYLNPEGMKGVYAEDNKVMLLSDFQYVEVFKKKYIIVDVRRENE